MTAVNVQARGIKARYRLWLTAQADQVILRQANHCLPPLFVQIGQWRHTVHQAIHTLASQHAGTSPELWADWLDFKAREYRSEQPPDWHARQFLLLLGIQPFTAEYETLLDALAQVLY